jgi:hypothetical protein
VKQNLEREINMSEELKELLKILEAHSALIATVVTTLDKVVAEQDRSGKAIGEAGAILLHHAETLQNLGMASVRMWHELKLPITEAPEVPPSSIN